MIEWDRENNVIASTQTTNIFVWDSYGQGAGGEPSFQAAWAENSNIIIYPGVDE